MKEYINITDAELQIMKVLWENYPLTSSEIIEAVSKSTPWKPKTIHTLISRLVKKGGISANRSSSYYQYTPLISKEELTNHETKSFLEKLYDGSIHLLVANFLKEESFSEEEIEELKHLLEEKIK